jgi:hypothetical protein
VVVVVVVMLLVVGWPGMLPLGFERGEMGGEDARAKGWPGTLSSGIDSVGVTLRMVGPRMNENSSRRRSRAAVCMVLSGVPAASLLLRLSRDCSMAGYPMVVVLSARGSTPRPRPQGR